MLVLCFGSCGILAPQAGSEPSPPALQGEVLTTGPPGKPWLPFSLMQLCRGEQRPCFKLLVKWGRMVPRHRPAINHTESHGCIRQEPSLSRSPPAPCKLMLYNLGLAASCLWTIPTLMLFLKPLTHIHVHTCTQTCAHIHRRAHSRSSDGQPAAAPVQ